MQATNSLLVSFTSTQNVESHEVEGKAFVGNSFVQSFMKFLHKYLTNLNDRIVLK